MPRTRITRTAVDRLPHTDRQVIHWDTKLTGFGVRCNPDSRSWIVSYRIDGIERRKILGRCDRMDIDVAYRQAEAIIKDAALGISPEQRRQLDTPPPAVKPVTLQQIIDDYFRFRKLKTSSADKYREHLDRYCADWLTLPVADITPDMIVDRHAVISTHAPAAADNAMGLIRALLNFAIDYHDGAVIDRNPTRKLSKLNGWTNPRPRTSHLSGPEIGPWLMACLKLRRDTSRDALLMILYTGARRDEILALRWEHVDLDGRIITLIDTKNGLPLTIPLCQDITDLLVVRRQRYPKHELVFPSRGATGRLTDLKAPLQAIADMGGKKIKCHDLRRTFLTACEELDIGIMTRKRLVNHSQGLDVTAGYTQVSMTKMRRAVELIADYIRQSVNSQHKNAADSK